MSDSDSSQNRGLSSTEESDSNNSITDLIRLNSSYVRFNTFQSVTNLSEHRHAVYSPADRESNFLLNDVGSYAARDHDTINMSYDGNNSSAEMGSIIDTSAAISDVNDVISLAEQSLDSLRLR